MEMALFGRYIVLSILLAWTLNLAGAAEISGTAKGKPPGTFQVKVSNGHLSLDASEAPLADVLKEIGKHASITMDSNIGPEEKITIHLDRVALEEGIRQLASNVTVFYAHDPHDKARHIERVVVLSDRSGASGQAKGVSQTEKIKESSPESAKGSKPPSKSEPFKFEFDPAKLRGKEKTGKQP